VKIMPARPQTRTVKNTSHSVLQAARALHHYYPARGKEGKLNMAGWKRLGVSLARIAGVDPEFVHIIRYASAEEKVRHLARAARRLTANPEEARLLITESISSLRECRQASVAATEMEALKKFAQKRLSLGGSRAGYFGKNMGSDVQNSFSYLEKLFDAAQKLL